MHTRNLPEAQIELVVGSLIEDERLIAVRPVFHLQLMRRHRLAELLGDLLERDGPPRAAVLRVLPCVAHLVFVETCKNFFQLTDPV